MTSGRKKPCRCRKLEAVNQNHEWILSFKSINPMMSLAKPGNPATGCQQHLPLSFPKKPKWS
jgi:hypothetical protein